MDITFPIGGVVAAVDGSPHSAATVRWAVEYAQRNGLAVTVVHAWTLDLPLAPYGYIAPFSATEAEADAVAVVDREVQPYGASVGGRAIRGTWRELVALTAESALLVVGAHARASHGSLGHFAHMLASHSHCPVTIVPSHTPTGRETSAAGPVAEEASVLLATAAPR